METFAPLSTGSTQNLNEKYEILVARNILLFNALKMASISLWIIVYPSIALLLLEVSKHGEC